MRSSTAIWLTVPEHFTAQEKRQTDGEQIPRISPGSMTHVHAVFLHEAAIWLLSKLSKYLWQFGIFAGGR